MNIAYSQPNRLKRLIAAGRIVLIGFAALAVWLRPAVSAAHITPVFLLFASLLCYSAVLFRFARELLLCMAGMLRQNLIVGDWIVCRPL
jgi:hypothetical protein